jgi:uncharacterized Zn-binding protein involved in type VI secretion
MASSIAVKTTDTAKGPHLAGGQSFYMVEGQPVVLLNDKVTPHGGSPHGPKPPTMVEASSFYKINGIGVVREGDLASCKHPSTGGSWYRVG